MARALGIDYGKRRIGVALSDHEKRIAFPHSIIETDIESYKDVSELCKQNDVDILVVGESKDFNNIENPIMKDIKNFVENFSKISNITVVYEPETLSSHQVSKIQGDTENLDSGAASVILQSYLNRLKYKNESNNI